MRKCALIFVAILAFASALAAQDSVIPFEARFWVLDNAKVVEQAGRQAVTGLAVLKDVIFEDGVIEFDVWAPDVRQTGGRAYPGVFFRMKTPQESERLYVRPHRAGLYADAIQYTPVFNGVAGWQLYNGEGFTNTLSFPLSEWVPMRIEVAGLQARVFVGKSASPALVVHELRRGLSRGAVALFAEGAAFFSNFRCRPDKDLRFPPPPPVDRVPGVLADWEISRGYRSFFLDTTAYPDAKMLADAQWRKVSAEPSGLVDLSRSVTFNGDEPETVLARTVVRSDGEGKALKLDFGYSDVVSIFLNGALLFAGDSTYRRRDTSFLGVVGYFDSVKLPLRRGENEIMLAVTESFGGWGFMCRDAEAVFALPGVDKAWQTERVFRVPESAAYDAARKAVYVSVFDPTAPSLGRGRQSVARVSADGKTVEAQWVAGLNNPTGLAVFKDTLYVAERAGLAVIDIPTGKILSRHPVQAPGLLNDVAVDPATGHVFVSDSAKNVILRFDGSKVEQWLTGESIPQPNGLLVREGALIVGTTGDGSLKSVDLETKDVSVLARLGGGVVDGIAWDETGGFLVSHNEGRLFRVTAAGEVTKILDTSAVGTNLADFTYIPELKTAVFPTYTDCRLVAFSIR